MGIAAGDAILRAAGGMLLDARKKNIIINHQQVIRCFFCSIFKKKMVKLVTRVNLIDKFISKKMF